MAQIAQVAIVGSGPAGLMAATELLRASSSQSVQIHLFERRPGLGRKLLIAGSSGLNISHELTHQQFANHYEGFSSQYWKELFESFGKENWIQFIEEDLGLETFLGTSNRYFVREMKASGLLKRWTAYLEERGVTIHTGHELTHFSSDSGGVKLTFLPKTIADSALVPSHFDYAIFSMGGASWETEEPSWVGLFRKQGIGLTPFEASNVGYELNWHKKFLAESEGKPLKKVRLKTARGEKLGEMVITSYGLEGTPIYFTGVPGHATLDLKPDLTEDEILNKLSQTKENLSPMRRVKHLLSLCEASESLLFHLASAEDKADLKRLIHRLKNLSLQLIKPRPLSEAISSKGGVKLDEITADLELNQYPRVYCAGEMLAWDAPTGGFLIQASISQGAWVGKAVSKNLV
jgi:uncharacterized flavoprotein (TIGR03862 family)